MGKRDDLIAKYAGTLRDKFGAEPDMALLDKAVKACGPSIYNADSETVATSQAKEVETVRRNFLIGKLGLDDGPHLDEGIDKVVEAYGRSAPKKYRAVLYYQLAKHFGCEDKLA